ncbi:hypothetical protein EVU97_00595 [Dermacoccus sp. 147Ba]|uniref:hypothetical protein n=1 Tax=Dermacoccus sp. 147Ba TaxID=2510111 RepID=UPI00101D7CEB|nr:hypothetical protein [Dermacoccus sp. 147Ba]RYI24256.1 hypothetical protein EVU97_00595 [Dermacoccus sp. 147Ba]
MFNLLVGLPTGGSLAKERVFEGTQPEVRTRLQASGDELKALTELPTLAMPELQAQDEQLARVGRITRITPSGRDYLLTFEPNRRISPIPTSEILAMIHELDVSNRFGLNRTYLTVKDLDLHRTLLERDGASDITRPSREYLNFPTISPEPNLVATMMPFADEFKPVYETIQRAAHAENMRCERADTIWEKHAIMDDVLTLLCTASVVVVDYSSRNSNVFYELGITHTLGRPCIPIAQSVDDIPFDLRSFRTLIYETTPVGLQKLQSELTTRIRSLTS